MAGLAPQLPEGEAVILDVPGISGGTDAEGVEWFRMSPEWVWGNAGRRAWARALAKHRKVRR